MTKRLVVPKGTLTNKEVAHFGACVRKWQLLLGLSEWRIELSTKAAPKNVLALVHRIELSHRLASIRINRLWHEEDVTPEVIERTACHEVCHIRLHELRSWAGTPGASEEDVDAAEHGVVIALANLLVPDAAMRRVMAGVK